MEAVEDRNLVCMSSGHQGLQVFDRVRLPEAISDCSVKLAIWVQKLVIDVDEDDGCGINHDDNSEWSLCAKFELAVERLIYRLELE